MNNQKKKILTVIGIIVASMFLFIGIICVQINGDNIAKNTYIGEVNIGGLNKDDAKSKLNENNKIEDIKLSYDKKDWNIDSSTVDFSYDIDKTVEKAYKVNRDGSFFENIKTTIKSNFNNKNNLEYEVKFNKEKLKTEIKNISKDIDVEVVNANININGSSINIEEEQDGKKVNIEKTIDKIGNNSKKGILTSSIVVETVTPKVKKESLKEVDTILGSYSTKVTGPVTGRHTNIRLATEKTSDVLLMPGETFSYNEYTGLRSQENGYKYAPVIVQGVLQEGLGGGVCQVSSTLFNATLYAGLDYVQLRNHSIPSGYVEMGRDAVVSDTGLDFIFKNNLKHPVYIKNYMSGNTIICQVYGSSKDKQNISISTNTDSVVDAPIKRIDDPSLQKGEEKLIEKGRKEYVVSTYRIFKDENGNVLRQERVLVSKYPKRQEVIAVGTKEIEIPKEPQIPEEPQNPEEPVEPEKPVVPQEPEGSNPIVPSEPVQPETPKPEDDQTQTQ